MFKENRTVFVCKNDIDKNWSYLEKSGFGGFTRAYLKREFDEYIDYFGEDKVVLTGSEFDTSRQRHTKFVSLNKFYRFVVKGWEKL